MPSSPKGLAIPAPLAAELLKDDVSKQQTLPTVGASDPNAEAAQAGLDGVADPPDQRGSGA